MATFVMVVGSWGSGTTAVAGALARLGLESLPPHFVTNDARTPDSHEAVILRNAVLRHVDQAALKLEPPRIPALRAELGRVREQIESGSLTGGAPPDVVVLKLPVAGLCLPVVDEVFSPRYVLVHRPAAEIEASRRRRRWSPRFGADSAARITTQAVADLVELRRTFLALAYGELVARPEATLRQVIAHCGLERFAARLPEAIAFIRPR